jgi:hypothetical protein
MKPIHVVGMGLWAPGFANVAAWREGRLDPKTIKPTCSLIDARLKRGTSLFANMLGEVVEQAAKEAALDLRTVATVYGSSLGEIETMVVLLRMLVEEEGKLSPVRFKNSVHNAASGLVSIATSNTAFTTAIAAGDRTFEMSLLEAWAYLEVHGGHVIVAVSDDRPPEPLRDLGDHDALAVALALSSDPAGSRGRLLKIKTQDGLSAPRQANPASAALALLSAVVERRGGAVSISLDDRSCVDVEV